MDLFIIPATVNVTVHIPLPYFQCHVHIPDASSTQQICCFADNAALIVVIFALWHN